MSRLNNAILSGAFAGISPAPMVDPRLGGQMGYAPDLSQFVNNAAYVQRPLVCLLMEAPAGFQYMPDPDFMVGALKAMVELHAKTITGLSRTLTTEWAENAVSGGGEIQQDLIDIKRERSNVTFTWQDKYGRPLQTLLEEWIINLMGDPDSKVPGIATIAGTKPTDLLPDMYTMTCLFFEPDPTFQTIVKAWLVTNMAPKGTGDITAKRDLPSNMESGEFSVEFTCLSSSTLGVRMFAQAFLDNINLTNANPNLRPSFLPGIEAEVAAQNTGFVNNAQTLGAQAVAGNVG